MDLSYSHNDNGGGSADGIFISKARILGVVDTSGLDNNGKVNDLSLQVKLAVEGVDFEPTFYISGNFKRDPNTNAVKSVGGAFKVLKFIMTVTGLDKIDLTEASGYRLDPVLLQELVGKEFWRLQYRSGVKPDGKMKYSTWSTVGHPDEDKEALREQFLSEFSTSGYPSNYLKEKPVVEKSPF